MITHKMLRYDFPEAIHIYPIFDVHYGSPLCIESKFRKYLEIIQEDPVGYTVLGGDLINNNIKTSPGIPYVDDDISPMQQKYDMVDFLRPLAEKNKILAACSWNHEYRTMRDSMQDLSRDIVTKLDLETCYHPDRIIMQIGVGDRSHGKRGKEAAYRYTVALWHGNGGGIKSGGTLNRAEDYIKGFSNLDLMFCGHTHNPMMKFTTQTCIDAMHNIYYDKACLVVVASSWLEHGGYAVRKGMPPVSVCECQKVTLNPPAKDDAGQNLEKASWLL